MSFIIYIADWGCMDDTLTIALKKKCGESMAWKFKKIGLKKSLMKANKIHYKK
jgi:hypothetical protein